MSNIEQQIAEIFSFLFEVENTPQLLEMQKEGSEKWDSMMQVAIISALEGEFDVAIDLDDAIKLESVKGCIELMETLG